MLNIPQVFRKFVVSYPNEIDGCADEEYFDDEEKIFYFVNRLSVPYTVYALYECLIWSTVTCDTNGNKKSVVNKY